MPWRSSVDPGRRSCSASTSERPETQLGRSPAGADHAIGPRPRGRSRRASHRACRRSPRRACPPSGRRTQPAWPRSSGGSRRERTSCPPSWRSSRTAVPWSIGSSKFARCTAMPRARRQGSLHRSVKPSGDGVASCLLSLGGLLRRHPSFRKRNTVPVPEATSLPIPPAERGADPGAGRGAHTARGRRLRRRG